MDWGWLTKILDPYERHARVAPALIVVLPLVLTSTAVSSDLFDGSRIFVPVLVAYLGIAVLTTIVRDAGVRVEPVLFKSWGGQPTTQLLRHRDSRIEAQTKWRFHAFFNGHVPGLKMPTEKDEHNDPRAADDVYASAVAWLREQTRDQKKYTLVFAENCGYGFRRNVFGSRKIGIGISVFSLATIVVAIIIAGNTATLAPPYYAAIATSMLLMICWAAIFRHSWVKQAAFAYAYRLLAACDSPDLKGAATQGKTAKK